LSDDVFDIEGNLKGMKKLATSGPKPSARYGHSAVRFPVTKADGTRMPGVIVFGGYAGGSDVRNDLYHFSITTKRWRRVEGIKGLPGRRFGHAMAVSNDAHVYVFGGRTAEGMVNGDLSELTMDLESEWAEKEAKAKPSKTSAQPSYEVQSAQLASMGFSDAAANLRVLRATKGNVDAAISRLISGDIPAAPEQNQISSDKGGQRLPANKYEVQKKQLADMGFTDSAKVDKALRLAKGDVNAAIAHLF